ncbi:MAG TPA: hypothetical protein VH186_10595 [Chloroflexia bacterium]|nr:hypothetical protein [Chloroflexia bacterium]
MKSKTKRFTIGGLLGLFALALLASFAFIGNGAKPANAQTASPTPSTSSTTSQNSNKAALRDSFLKNFASQLGVDQSKLNSAFTNAVSTTVDQAVKDGTLTQAQADRIKQQAANGFKGFIPGGKGHRGGNFSARQGHGQALSAAAQALGITENELRTDLRTGQSISDVAKSKNIDLNTVKTAVLNSVKSQFDQAVKDGKLTQAQADSRYQNFSTNIDKFLSRTFPGKNQSQNQNQN